MKNFFIKAVLIVAGTSTTTYSQSSLTTQHNENICNGFFPEQEAHKRQIPAYGYLNEGISLQEFNEVNELAQKVYSKHSKIYNATFKVIGNWESPVANGYASKIGSKWITEIYGGIARAKGMTKDAYSVVVCHEIGHLFAGFPIVTLNESAYNYQDTSIEGNSDYYATHSCFYELYKDDAEGNLFAEQNASEFVKETCKESHTDKTRQQICMRGITAGNTLWSSHNKNPNETLSPQKKDPYVIHITTRLHPDFQCRVDTYVSGATCDKPSFADMKFPLTKDEMNNLTCSAKKYGQNHYKGVRPLCWFNPKKIETEPTYIANEQFAGSWASQSCLNRQGTDMSLKRVTKFSMAFDNKGIVSYYENYYKQKDCQGEKVPLLRRALGGTYEFSNLDPKTNTRDLKIFREIGNKFITFYTKVTWKKISDNGSEKMAIFFARPTKDALGDSPETRATLFTDYPDGILEN